MRANRTNPIPPAKIYVEKAKVLSSSDAELLKERVLGRFTRRSEDKKKTRTEVVALQLEFEDLQLNEWRNRLVRIRETEGAVMGVSHIKQIDAPSEIAFSAPQYETAKLTDSLKPERRAD